MYSLQDINQGPVLALSLAVFMRAKETSSLAGVEPNILAAEWQAFGDFYPIRRIQL
jgi:hypothetical protein